MYFMLFERAHRPQNGDCVWFFLLMVFQPTHHRHHRSDDRPTNEANQKKKQKKSLESHLFIVRTDARHIKQPHKWTAEHLANENDGKIIEYMREMVSSRHGHKWQCDTTINAENGLCKILYFSSGCHFFFFFILFTLSAFFFFVENLFLR